MTRNLFTIFIKTSINNKQSILTTSTRQSSRSMKLGRLLQMKTIDDDVEVAAEDDVEEEE